jgi:hypothetical protein
MKKWSFVLLITLCTVFSAHGQTKRQDIIKLLEITGTKSQFTQMIDLMLADMQSTTPGAPAEFWTKFKAGLKADGFIEMLIPIYDKYLSHDDIKKIIQFYESPVGKKLISITPQLTQDSYSAGEKWGEKLAADIIKELSKQGNF